MNKSQGVIELPPQLRSGCTERTRYMDYDHYPFYSASMAVSFTCYILLYLVTTCCHEGLGELKCKGIGSWVPLCQHYDFGDLARRGQPCHSRSVPRSWYIQHQGVLGI